MPRRVRVKRSWSTCPARGTVTRRLRLRVHHAQLVISSAFHAHIHTTPPTLTIQRRIWVRQWRTHQQPTKRPQADRLQPTVAVAVKPLTPLLVAPPASEEPQCWRIRQQEVADPAPACSAELDACSHLQRHSDAPWCPLGAVHHAKPCSCRRRSSHSHSRSTLRRCPPAAGVRVSSRQMKMLHAHQR